mmetsp:Transcript_38395/g.89261  ORF Transcript_38395/g.89261 Transcript_38395/m.89261 type:complete len:540 (-) Transcript_38395:257-1876(-)
MHEHENHDTPKEGFKITKRMGKISKLFRRTKSSKVPPVIRNLSQGKDSNRHDTLNDIEKCVSGVQCTSQLESQLQSIAEKSVQVGKKRNSGRSFKNRDSSISLKDIKEIDEYDENQSRDDLESSDFYETADNNPRSKWITVNKVHDSLHLSDMSVCQNNQPIVTMGSKEKRAFQLSALSKLRKEDWEGFFDIVSTKPDIMTMPSDRPEGQTILHTLCAQKEVPPLDIIRKMIFLRPIQVTTVDAAGCLPLHYAAARPCQKETVKLMVGLFRVAATITDMEGNLPVHIASAVGIGNEDSVKTLLRAYPKSVKVANRLGHYPLHYACYSKTCSTDVVQRILDVHKFTDIDPFIFNGDGYTPLHITIKSRKSASVVAAFLHDKHYLFSKCASQPDIVGNLPIHLALSQTMPNEEVVNMILDVAPLTFATPSPSGIFPIQLATEASLSDYLIERFLKFDLPCKSATIARQYFPVWWHVAVNTGDKYMCSMDKILTKEASNEQIQKLSISMDKSYRTRLVDACTPNFASLIKCLLWGNAVKKNK